jgi:hypothetical protein
LNPAWPVVSATPKTQILTPATLLLLATLSADSRKTLELHQSATKRSGANSLGDQPRIRPRRALDYSYE